MIWATVGAAEVLVFLLICVGVVFLIGKLINLIDNYYFRRQINKLNKPPKT